MVGEPEGIVSVDDHVIEPPDLWLKGASTRDRDRVPHTVVGDDGILYWVYDNMRSPISGTTAQAGLPVSQRRLGYIQSYDELLPGHYDAAARTALMDRDGVLASLCFPTVPRFCGQAFLEADDKELALRCLRAYNDWMIDGWAGAAPGRFIPIIVVPLWDPPGMAAEIRRCAALGARAISFSENPSKLGLPSIHDQSGYWEPLLSAADETGLPICIHFGSSSTVPTTSADAPLFVTGSLAPVNLMYSLVDWIFSGKLLDGARLLHPNVKICLSEGGIGWIPYILERCDYMVANRPYLQESDWKADLASGRAAAFSAEGARRMGMLPSELFRHHFYGCFIDDQFGARHLGEVGVDNVMLETDFPHTDSSYPDSMERATSNLASYDPETRYKVMQGNARRVFGLSP